MTSTRAGSWTSPIVISDDEDAVNQLPSPNSPVVPRDSSPEHISNPGVLANDPLEDHDVDIFLSPSGHVSEPRWSDPHPSLPSRPATYETGKSSNVSKRSLVDRLKDPLQVSEFPMKRKRRADRSVSPPPEIETSGDFQASTNKKKKLNKKQQAAARREARSGLQQPRQSGESRQTDSRRNERSGTLKGKMREEQGSSDLGRDEMLRPRWQPSTKDAGWRTRTSRDEHMSELNDLSTSEETAMASSSTSDVNTSATSERIENQADVMSSDAGESHNSSFDTYPPAFSGFPPALSPFMLPHLQALLLQAQNSGMLWPHGYPPQMWMLAGQDSMFDLGAQAALLQPHSALMDQQGLNPAFAASTSTVFPPDTTLSTDVVSGTSSHRLPPQRNMGQIGVEWPEGPCTNNSRGVFNSKQYAYITRDPAASLVLQVLPRSLRNQDFWHQWVVALGIDRMDAIIIDKTKALLVFKSAADAQRAFESPRMVGGDGRTGIRASWYREVDRLELEEGEIADGQAPPTHALSRKEKKTQKTTGQEVSKALQAEPPQKVGMKAIPSLMANSPSGSPTTSRHEDGRANLPVEMPHWESSYPAPLGFRDDEHDSVASSRPVSPDRAAEGPTATQVRPVAHDDDDMDVESPQQSPIVSQTANHLAPTSPPARPVAALPPRPVNVVPSLPTLVPSVPVALPPRSDVAMLSLVDTGVATPVVDFATQTSQGIASPQARTSSWGTPLVIKSRCSQVLPDQAMHIDIPSITPAHIMAPPTRSTSLTPALGKLALEETLRRRVFETRRTRTPITPHEPHGVDPNSPSSISHSPFDQITVERFSVQTAMSPALSAPQATVTPDAAGPVGGVSSDTSGDLSSTMTIDMYGAGSTSFTRSASTVGLELNLDDLAASFIEDAIQTVKYGPPISPPLSSAPAPLVVQSLLRPEASAETDALAAKQRQLEIDEDLAKAKSLMAKLDTARSKGERDALMTALKMHRRLMDIRTKAQGRWAAAPVRVFRWPETLQPLFVHIDESDFEDDE